jgi:NhaP-type Na+/H+ or K+/H+ antiporter
MPSWACPVMFPILLIVGTVLGVFIGWAKWKMPQQLKDDD